MQLIEVGQAVLKTHKMPARKFFDKKFWPVMLDDARPLCIVCNSVFEKSTRKVKGDDTVRQNESPAERKRVLKEFHEKVRSGVVHGGILVGGPAEGQDATTSSQCTGIPWMYTEDDLYASWIGSAMGITIEGGTTLLINHPKVLDILYRGWKEYRKVLTGTPDLKGRQLPTWNGYYLYTVVHGLTKVDPASLEKPIPFVELMYTLTKLVPRTTLTAYCYTLANTNSTYGYLQIDTGSIAQLLEMYTRLYGRPEWLLSTDVCRKVYQVPFMYDDRKTGQRSIFSSGVVGVRQMRPLDNNKSPITSDILSIWTRIMTNDEAIGEKAVRWAHVFYNYRHTTNKNEGFRAPEALLKTPRPTKQGVTHAVTEMGMNTELDDFIQLMHTKWTTAQLGDVLSLVRHEFAKIKESKKKGKSDEQEA